MQLITREEEQLKHLQQQNEQSFRDKQRDTAGLGSRSASDEAAFEASITNRAHEQEMILNAQKLESSGRRLGVLKKMKDSPYFARIDFSEEDELVETLYIGIASLREGDETIMIDWRAPIANLYYEGELGQAYYESALDQYWVELLLKRQFKIEDGRILSLVDTSEVISDDFLLSVLDEDSSDHMRSIVATIQKEQNKIIRDTASPVMLIEGIAGSGKTSALMQRIAFILYHFRTTLKNSEILLFSPNKIFSEYISTVLPSLGEEDLPALTFSSFMRILLPNVTIDLPEKAEEALFLSGEDESIHSFKNSLDSVAALNQYIQKITPVGPIFRPLKAKDDELFSKAQLKEMYQATNPKLPLYQRIALLQGELLQRLTKQQSRDLKAKWVQEEVDLTIDNLTMRDIDPSTDDTKLRKQIAKSIVAKKYRAVRRKINRFGFISYNNQYLHFLSSLKEDHLAQIAESDWAAHLANVKKSMREQKLTLEDAMLYGLLLKKINGQSPFGRIKYIFIDEMQDFTPLQVQFLQEFFSRTKYTFCGDLNQSVFGNQNITGFMDQLFPEQQVTHIRLTTSYRSTAAITNFANQFLTQEEAVSVTARAGTAPVVKNLPNYDSAIAYLSEQLDLANERQPRWRKAIIGKTLIECQQLAAALDRSDLKLIEKDTDSIDSRVLIIPAFLAKGLEFDQVFAWGINQANFLTDHDKLILYTIATRAMHELMVISDGEMSGLIKEATPAFN